MKKLSDQWHKRMALHLLEHRKYFNEGRMWFSKIRLRHFAGHKEHVDKLSQTIRVAHLTDQHVGRVTPHSVQYEAVELALKQDPDIVVLTGDFVCHSELFLDDLTEIIKRIDRPKFAVLGNHDHWTNAAAVKKALMSGGAEVLENQHTEIRIRNDILQIVGVDDAYTKHADVAKATKGMRKDLATIGLSHIAEEADHLWLKGVPLVLSGHTHAGQITVAGLHELLLKKVVGHKYVHGFYGSRENGCPEGAVYVSAGIGAAVMPLRMGEKGKREVAVFELGATEETLKTGDPSLEIEKI
ncbi:MAG TPA: metallophosphoesterase [Myxococcota bacterium]|nr:metallophosphoesterase [Myxococcota bacterium]